MYKLKRILFHIRKGTLFTAVINLCVQFFKSKDGLPIGNTYHGEKALIYDNHRENDLYWKAEDNCVKEYISQFSSEIKSVLDAPYGTGRFAPIYHKYDLKVVGIDISEEMLAVAKTKHKKYLDKTEFLIQDMTNIRLADSSIDLVICFRFIPWIISFNEAKIALSELSRICNKYAIIELCVGKHNDSKVEIDGDKVMWNNYNKEQIISWLKEFNFEVTDVKFLFDDKEHPGLSAFLCKKIA